MGIFLFPEKAEILIISVIDFTLSFHDIYLKYVIPPFKIEDFSI